MKGFENLELEEYCHLYACDREDQCAFTRPVQKMSFAIFET
jgi:hypothetical protein